MSNRDFAVVALGRFLVVERYRETCPPSSTGHLGNTGPDRTGGHAGTQDARSGSPAPEFPASRHARRHPDLGS